MANRVFKVGPDTSGISGSATIPSLEEGFVNPELFAMLTPEEKVELQKAYESYGTEAARSAYLGKKVWDKSNQVDWTGEWQRGMVREVQSKRRLEALVEQYAQKYGMAVTAEEPEEATVGTR